MEKVPFIEDNCGENCCAWKNETLGGCVRAVEVMIAKEDN